MCVLSVCSVGDFALAFWPFYSLIWRKRLANNLDITAYLVALELQIFSFHFKKKFHIWNTVHDTILILTNSFWPLDAGIYFPGFSGMNPNIMLHCKLFHLCTLPSLNFLLSLSAFTKPIYIKTILPLTSLLILNRQYMIPSVLTLPSPLMTLLWLHFKLHFEGKLLYYESGVKENIAYIKDLYKKNIIFDLLSQSWALKIIPTVSTWKILLWNAQAFIWQGRFKDFVVYVHKRKRSLDFLLQASYNRDRVVQSQNISLSKSM